MKSNPSVLHWLFLNKGVCLLNFNKQKPFENILIHECMIIHECAFINKPMNLDLYNNKIRYKLRGEMKTAKTIQIKPATLTSACVHVCSSRNFDAALNE